MADKKICSGEIPPLKDVKCGNIEIPRVQYTFENGKCYGDGRLIGDIIFSDEKTIQVKQNNGSLADGTIRTFIKQHP